MCGAAVTPRSRAAPVPLSDQSAAAKARFSTTAIPSNLDSAPMRRRGAELDDEDEDDGVARVFSVRNNGIIEISSLPEAQVSVCRKSNVRCNVFQYRSSLFLSFVFWPPVRVFLGRITCSHPQHQ